LIKYLFGFSNLKMNSNEKYAKNQNCHFIMCIVSLPQQATYHAPYIIIATYYTLKGSLNDEKLVEFEYIDPDFLA